MIALALLSATLLRAPADSVPVLVECREPKPVGAVVASGLISYVLTEDLDVDEKQLAVLEVRGISAAGLRSIALRVVPHCKFRMPRQLRVGRQGIAVQQQLTVAKGEVSLGPTMPRDPAREPLALRVPPFDPERTFEATDPMLEELPGRGACAGSDEGQVLIPHDEIVSVVRVDGVMQGGLPPSPPPDARTVLPAMGGTVGPGAAELTYVVAEDGRVSVRTLKVLSSTSKDIAGAARETVLACRHAPGRIGGIPVRVRVTETFRNP